MWSEGGLSKDGDRAALAVDSVVEDTQKRRPRVQQCSEAASLLPSGLVGMVADSEVGIVVASIEVDIGAASEEVIVAALVGAEEELDIKAEVGLVEEVAMVVHLITTELLPMLLLALADAVAR